MKKKAKSELDFQPIDLHKDLYVDVKSTVATCVIYDKKDGRIIHTHQIMTLPGASPPTEAELEAEARKLASRIAGKPMSAIAGLPVKTEDLQIGTDYRVDLKKKVLRKMS